MKHKAFYLGVTCLLFMVACAQNQESTKWRAKHTPIITRWGKTVTPENAYREYPRPNLVRSQWQSLNGLWDYALLSAEEKNAPSNWDGKILVPYPIQSALSGVAIQQKDKDAIWYRTFFELPDSWRNQSIMLHFEAVDFETTLWVNGKEVGSHLGSYNAFSFDVTDYINDTGENEIIVRTYDGSTISARSIGKQNAEKYDAYEDLSGIWQSVWLEPVNGQASIQDIRTTTTLTDIKIDVKVTGDASNAKLRYLVKDGGEIVSETTTGINEVAQVSISNPKLWSPDLPFLYDIEIILEAEDGENLDKVSSYFGMRTIEVDKSKKPAQIVLNGEPIFQFGPLDQNYWPESGMVPPSNAAMLWEAEYLKSIGCNMVRLHIKRNPRSFYTHCDRVGLLVWQDFVCGEWKNNNPTREHSDFWVNEQKTMQEQLYNHPSIVMWVIFNESWGQHDTERVFDAFKPLDSTRLLSVASGWTDAPGLGDIRDLHDYTFRPAVPVDETRAIVLGECGGFASAVPPHNWTGRSNKTGEIEQPLHGGFNPSIPRDKNTTHDIFRPTFTYGEAFDGQHERFIDNLYHLKANGLVAAVYTQMTDMKLEENGWLTFDREVSKINPEKSFQLTRKLYESAPEAKLVLEASVHGSNEKWMSGTIPLPEKKGGKSHSKVLQEGIDLEMVEWKEVEAPFHYGETEEHASGWNEENRLILKRDITLEVIPEKLSFRVYSKISSNPRHEWVHSRLYINGEFVLDETTRHEQKDMKMAHVPFNNKARQALKEGKNTIVIEVVPGLSRNNIMKVPENLEVDYEIVSW